MKTKHTQGKWVFNNESLDHMHVEVKNQDGYWKHVAHVYTEHNNPPRYEEAEANAKLIAAAPELLEALVEFVEMMSVFHKNKSGDGSQVGKCLSKVETAIKKATE